MNENSIHPDSAYAIIARCLELKHINGNLYHDAKDKPFFLTKYGFYPSVLEDIGILRIENRELKQENLRMKHKLNKVSKNEKGDINFFEKEQEYLVIAHFDLIFLAIKNKESLFYTRRMMIL